MNFLPKKALLALTLLSCVGSTFGYDWVFNNKTNKPVIIEMTLQADIPMHQRYFRIAEPGRPASFRFVGVKGIHCYKSIRVAEWNLQDVNQYITKFNLNQNEKSTLLSIPTGGDLYQVNLDKVQYYFWEYTMFHTPQIIYPKSAFDTSKIVEAMTALGHSSEKAGELIARAAAAYSTGGASEVGGSTMTSIVEQGKQLVAGLSKGGATPAKDNDKAGAIPVTQGVSAGTKTASAGSLDLGLAKLLGAMTGLIIEGVGKGACGSRTLDLYGVEVEVPGIAGRKENAYIFVNREN